MGWSELSTSYRACGFGSSDIALTVASAMDFHRGKAAPVLCTPMDKVKERCGNVLAEMSTLASAPAITLC